MQAMKVARCLIGLLISIVGLPLCVASENGGTWKRSRRNTCDWLRDHEPKKLLHFCAEMPGAGQPSLLILPTAIKLEE